MMMEESINPLCLDIETASICDLACPFAIEVFNNSDKIIDDKVCFDLIDQAVEMGIPSIKFNWRGEPLLHPKLPEFISYTEKGILETMIIQMQHLNHKMANKLIDSGLDFNLFL